MKKYPVRIPPLSPDNFTDLQKELVGDWSNMNFCRVIVQHPEMYKVFLPYIETLIAGSSLPPRDREILVLRALAVADDVYETLHHETIARNADISDAEIKAAQGDGNNEVLSDFDRLLMRAVDELMSKQNISDITWAGLSERYTDKQVIEVVFLVGCYTVMAMLTNSFGIPIEENAEDEFTELRQYK